MPSQNRAMPQNIEAEQAVLGAMLISEDAVSSVSQILKPADFYREDHRTIFESMTRLHVKSEPVDMVTVAEELATNGKLEKAGGMALISQLNNMVPTAANATHYANIVREKAELRNLINAATEIATSAYDESDEATNIIDKAESRIMQISSRRSSGALIPLNNILMDTVDQFEKIFNAKGQIMGLSTGFADLDRMTSGLQPSDLILVAARPSMGKTAFTLNIASNVAILANRPVAFFSLEMSGTQLMMRIIGALGGINTQEARTGNITDEDWDKLMHTANKIYNAPLYIDDTPGISIMELRSKARRIKAEHGLELIVIDYLQLMTGSSSAEGRQQEVSEISRSLKALARELNVPIITLSQLNRGVESRQIKRPMLSDLRESGSLEQDADIVMFLYREDYYTPETERKNITDIIIAKHRNGPIGDVELLFRKEYTKFENLSKSE